jgi:ubiquitin-conjugating enzyme E2 C
MFSVSSQLCAAHQRHLTLKAYEGLTFKLTLSFPSDYPYSAPTVRFETPCYHPNVDQAGNICLDILKVLFAAPMFMHILPSVLQAACQRSQS